MEVMTAYKECEFCGAVITPEPSDSIARKAYEMGDCKYCYMEEIMRGDIGHDAYICGDYE